MTGVNPWVVFAIASSDVFLVTVDATVAVAAFPALRASFTEASPAALSWVLNAYTILYAALLVPAGRLVDLHGSRRLFVFGVTLFTLASTACGLAAGTDSLIAARVVQASSATPRSKNSAVPASALSNAVFSRSTRIGGPCFRSARAVLARSGRGFASGCSVLRCGGHGGGGRRGGSTRARPSGSPLLLETASIIELRRSLGILRCLVERGVATLKGQDAVDAAGRPVDPLDDNALRFSLPIA